MAGSDTIKVTLGVGIEVELDKDTPNVREFVKAITENRASIDIERIAVEGPTPDFDDQSFKEVVVEVVSDYLNSIAVEEKKYLAAIGHVESEQD